MMRTKGLLLAVLTMSLVACGGKSGGKSKGITAIEATNPAPSEPTSNPGNDPGTSTGNVPPQALSFKVNLKYIGLSDAQIEKFNDAIEIIQRVVASDEFRDLILNHTYKGVKIFVNNNGLSNEQIYQSILDAAEKLKPAKDNVMELDVQMYSSLRSVLSYTFPNLLKVWFNLRYFNNYDAAELAERVMHEWIHKLGFDHDGTTTASRKFTVPYAIAKMMLELGKTYQ